MKPRSISYRAALALALTVAWTSTARAQEEAFQGGQTFRLMAPGARALAMGGGFFGMADDATAAVANPAGLVQLQKREFSAEVRAKDSTTSTWEGESNYSFVSPSFFSVAFPGRRVSGALFYDEPVRHEFDATTPSGDDRDYCSCTGFRATSTIKLRSFGVSLAARLHDRVSLGVSTAAAQVTSRADLEYVGNPWLRGPAFGADGESTVPYINAGLLINPGGKFSFGAGFEWFGDYTVTAYDNRRGLEFEEATSLPMSVYVGVAARPTAQLTLSAGAKAYDYGENSGSAYEGRGDNAEGEWHVGGEYTTLLGGKTPLSLRGGAFGQSSPITGDDEVNGTFGAGVVFGGKLQVDAAVSIGTSMTQGLISCVVWF